MTEHRNPAEARRPDAGNTEPKKGGASLFEDAPFRAEFLMIVAMAANQGKKGWEFFMAEVVPKAITEARKYSRTPKLDCAFIEGVVSGLNAERALHDAGKRL